MGFRKVQMPAEVKHIEPVLPGGNFGSVVASLERDIQDEIVRYAPPAVRNGPPQIEEPVLPQIKAFGELPTKEIDEIISAAEDEIGRLKSDAQAVRDMYTKHTTRIVEEIKRLQEGVKLSLETMKTLREQCAQLDAPALEAPKEPTE